VYACTPGATSGPPGTPPETTPTGGDGGAATSGDSQAPALAAGALPTTTFLYVSKPSADSHVLMAFDTTTGKTRVVTDLRGDGSEGWPIGGYAISPDRTRIAMATLYGPTKADNDTRLATRRIWTFSPDGTDFKRLTPVFENTGGGRSGFSLEVRDPMFSRDGTQVLYNYGEYWYEGTSLEGGSGIWSVATAGGALPTLFKRPNPCTFLDASTDPSTGNVTITHSVCIPGQGVEGIHLYPPDGSGTPELLVPDDGTTSVSLETPRWAADGSRFVFVGVRGVPENGTTRNARSLYVFDMASRKALPVVVPAAGASVIDGTIAPDSSAIIYCLQQGNTTNLHAIDFSTDPPTEAALTDDGVSCHPVW